MKQMRIIRLGILLLAFSVIVSCECHQIVKGTVVDSETNFPIANVKIKSLKSGDSLNVSQTTIYTDSLGKFDFFSNVGGLLGCPKVILSFEKEGYEKITKKYKPCCSYKEKVVLRKIE